MRELQSIIQHYHKFKAKGLKMALATVIHVENSSYRRTGARMLITEDGQWTGGISGGCLEGDTLRKAKLAIINQKSTIVRYDTRDGDPNEIGIGLGCHGLIDVIISPINTSASHNSINTLELSLRDRKSKVLLTLLEGNLNNIDLGKVYPIEVFTSLLDQTFKKELLKGISDTQVNNKSNIKVFGLDRQRIKIFFEHLPPPIHLVICGRNYDTVPLSKIGKEIGWKVSIISNPLKVSHQLSSIVDDVVSSLEQITIDEYTAILLMSHDYSTDVKNFKKLLEVQPPYIGLLGPSDRRDKLINEIKNEGLVVDLTNIYGPIGIDTGATTPGEIAISIIAEIRTHFNKRSGGHLRDRNLPINS